MKKVFCKALISAFCILGWWEWIYPELVFESGTYHIVYEDGSEEELTAEKYRQQESSFYEQFLATEEEEIIYYSRLWNWITGLCGK